MTRSVYVALAALLCLAFLSGPSPSPIARGQPPPDPKPAIGPAVVLPDALKGSVGAWVPVAPKLVVGGAVKWRIDPGLTEVDFAGLFPPDIVAKMTGKVVTSDVPGKYRVEAWNAKGDLASDIAVCWVTIGTPPPPVPIPPGPDPPGPKPDPPPIPASGLRALIVYETADLGKIPAAQASVLTAKSIPDYLNSKCPIGP